MELGRLQLQQAPPYGYATEAIFRKVWSHIAAAQSKWAYLKIEPGPVGTLPKPRLVRGQDQIELGLIKPEQIETDIGVCFRSVLR
jgi:hypothetical protein